MDTSAVSTLHGEASSVLQHLHQLTSDVREPLALDCLPGKTDIFAGIGILGRHPQEKPQNTALHRTWSVVARNREHTSCQHGKPPTGNFCVHKVKHGSGMGYRTGIHLSLRKSMMQR